MVKLKPQRTVSRTKKVVLIVVAMCAGLIGATLAVPKLMSPDADDAWPTEATAAAPTGRTPEASAPVTAPEPTAEVDDVVDEDLVLPDPIVPTTTDGDLSVELSVEATTHAFGAPVKSRVSLINHDDEAFHVPAEGEPQPHMEVVVVDAEGNEVRRIAEEGDGAMPTHTVRIDPGHRRHFSVDVVAEGEDPLPLGQYAVHVEFDSSPVWRRLGLRTWQATNGRLRSPAVLIEVVAAE